MDTVRETKSVKRYCLPIEIDQEGEFFLAKCPAWSDCYAQGKTADEATSEIIAVASTLIELYREEGLPVPLEVEKFPGKISFDVPVFAN